RRRLELFARCLLMKAEATGPRVRTWAVVAVVAAMGALLIAATELTSIPPASPQIASAQPPSSASKPFRWGGDAEGGAPFVEADATDPTKVRGFDVEIAELIARGLGREPQFVQVAWASIEQSTERGDFEIGMSGVEDRAELRARHSVTLPYYEFYEVLAVRAADSAKYRTLDALAKHKVATLGGTKAYEILLDAQKRVGVVPVSYDDDVHPYTDLVAGRVDAVLLDHVIAERSLRRTGKFVIQPQPVDTGHYVGVMALTNSALRDSANRVLLARMRDGTLETVFRKWDVWDERQAAFQQRLIASLTADVQVRDTAIALLVPDPKSVFTYLPALLRAAGITLVLSCLAMALAVTIGIIVAAGRVYGPRPVRALLMVYVEIIRGTPVLLQLFVLYYGLSGVVKLPAFVAAVVGLGLNYAAYESEIYRAALENISRAQLEAARTLGLSEMQILRLVRGPQALRLALAPMTNDFVALLKDSSLVSVITVVELTKQTAIYATNIGSWVVPGILCSLVYLAMSLPLSQVARRLERKWSKS
ncbi:MAG: ABC transporter substrate-binding protein/permease, partial [Gemmatimonadaceae bacterium]